MSREVWFNFVAPLTLLVIAGLGTWLMMRLTRDISERPPNTVESDLLAAVRLARVGVEDANRASASMDELLAALRTIEDAVLALPHPSLPARLAQADIRLRRRAVAVENAAEAEELEAIRGTLLASASALAGAIVEPAPRAKARRKMRVWN